MSYLPFPCNIYPKSQEISVINVNFQFDANASSDPIFYKISSATFFLSVIFGITTFCFKGFPTKSLRKMKFWRALLAIKREIFQFLENSNLIPLNDYEKKMPGFYGHILGP